MMSNESAPTSIAPPPTSDSPRNPSPQMVSLSAGFVAGSSVPASAAVNRQIRIARIILRDFRAFPNNPDNYEFDLGDGKNMLLFGENGSGKSSLFHALRLLLSDQPPPKPFDDYRHVFTKGTEGTVTVTLTAGQVRDYTWNTGAGHPITHGGGQPFLDYIQRTTFLDYKSLLRTSLPYEDENCVDIFDLVLNTLLKNTIITGHSQPLPDEWKALKSFQPSSPPRGTEETDEDYRETVAEWPNPEQQKYDAVEDFWKIFDDFLARITTRANHYLAQYLQTNLTIEIKSAPKQQQDVSPERKLLLTARYAGHSVSHPAQFLNEARLSAIALALYLAATIETTPVGTTSVSGTGSSSHPGRLLVLDDPLLGIDLSHRLPLLDLLQSQDFAEWQVLLFTFDAHWFDMASDRLPEKFWVKHRLHAKVHPEKWEMPILEADAPYLDRAWSHIQSGDFKAAGVYLRTAWEDTMRVFCEVHPQIKVSLKREMHEYKAEDFWPLVRAYEVKPHHRLVDPGLSEEIDICRRYVLNPLCHNDPARPTREEVRSAHSSVSRLKILLEQQAMWFKQMDSQLRAATVQIIGDNEKIRERALKGLALPDDIALYCAGRLLANADPPLKVIAPLLRSAFDQALWRFCAKKAIQFTFTCDKPLNTNRLWQEATNGAGALATSHAALVAAINAHADLMVADSPDDSVFATKSVADLQSLFAALCGNGPANPPKMIMDSW